MQYSVIIPNRFPDLITPLIESIHKFISDPKPRIVIISDGHNRNYGFESISYSEEHFVFSKAVNLGIKATGSDDVFLVNDDITLIEPDTFQRLDSIAQAHLEIGILSPLTKGCVGNPIQRYHERGLYWTTSQTLKYIHGLVPVCFPCVWIRRKMLDEIGFLDERFVDYGGEDNELCIRARKVSWRTAVTSQVVVQHGDGSSALAGGRGRSWSCSYARRDSTEKI